jgi:hypothetical protein
MRVNSQVAGNLTSKAKRIPLKRTFLSSHFSLRFNNMKNEKKERKLNSREREEKSEEEKKAEEDNEKSIFERDGG